MESQNSIQNLRNNLTETTLIKNIDALLDEEKMNSRIRAYLSGLRQVKKLYKLCFGKECEYIENYYNLAFSKFQTDKKVAKLSFGLAYIYEDIFLYIKKEEEESLNFLKKYENITPVDFSKYMKTNSAKSSMKSDLLLNGGMNLYGYSFEFNINYFLQTLSNLMELPELSINLTNGYREASFEEIDISYYNKESSINQNKSLLRTSAYFQIFKGNIIHEKNKDFDIYEKSLILGEVKSRFPNILIKKNEINGKTSLESIINKLFHRLDFFYKLYSKTGLIAPSDIENIQLIFFYDNVQLANINENAMKNFITNNSDNWKSFREIPIHLFIVYTLPAITNISIYELKKGMQLLEGKNKETEDALKNMEKNYEDMEKKYEDVKKELQELKDKNRQIMFEINVLKFNQNNAGGYNLNNTGDNDKNNKIKANNDDNIFSFLLPFDPKVNQNTNVNQNNNINNNNNNNNNLFDFSIYNEVNNDIISNNNINDNNNKDYFDFTIFNTDNNNNNDKNDNNIIDFNNTDSQNNNTLGDLLFFGEDKNDP